MKVTANSGTFEQAPAGTEVARCIRVIDLGTQTDSYQGKTTIRRQVLIAWELCNAIMETGEKAGQPFTISRFYTASIGEKANLRKDLVAWRGKDFTEQELEGFELRNILGAACMLSLVADAKTHKTKVASVMALAKGTQVPQPVNQLVYFSLEPGEFDRNVFESLSNGIKAIIHVSPEYAELTQARPAMASTRGLDSLDDDIPF